MHINLDFWFYDFDLFQQTMYPPWLLSWMISGRSVFILEYEGIHEKWEDSVLC